jgi:hypothetical protein
MMISKAFCGGAMAASSIAAISRRELLVVVEVVVALASDAGAVCAVVDAVESPRVAISKSFGGAWLEPWMAVSSIAAVSRRELLVVVEVVVALATCVGCGRGRAICGLSVVAEVLGNAIRHLPQPPCASFVDSCSLSLPYC